LTWTQKQIAEWQTATFGPLKSAFICVCRANEEMAELLRDLSKDPMSPAAAVEAADVIIVLSALAENIGIDLNKTSAVSGGSPIVSALEAAYSMTQALRCAEQDLRSPIWYLLDVRAHLGAMVHGLGLNLQTEIDKKMEINVARKWAVDGDGCGKHIRVKDAPAKPKRPAGRCRFLESLEYRSDQVVRHAKRGSIYQEIYRGGELQASGPIKEGDKLVTYVGEDGKLWHRKVEEFDDTRYIPTPHPDLQPSPIAYGETAIGALLMKAREIRMTPEQEADQRRSFVHGNCAIDNPLVTREMVDEADKRMLR
jgi:hypothetical protein